MNFIRRINRNATLSISLVVDLIDLNDKLLVKLYEVMLIARNKLYEEKILQLIREQIDRAVYIFLSICR